MKSCLLWLFLLANFIRGNDDDFQCFDGEKQNINWSLNDLHQEDPTLIKILRDKYLIPPSDKDYNFSVPISELNYRGQYQQPIVIDNQIFKNKVRNGFFIEAGAYDGELISNTLHFEIRRNWSGLLIEPNPEALKALLQKNRKAWIFGHCLSTQKKPEVVSFDVSGLYGGIEHESNKPGFEMPNEYFRRSVLMQCFPLYSVLLALGRTKIDYLSLDIEGAELPVLKTLPFDKLDIKVLDVETNHVGEIFDGTLSELLRLIKSNGYKYHSRIAIDDIFVQSRFKIK